MIRSKKKGPYVDFKVYKKVKAAQQMGSKEPIKTWARACTIVPEFVGLTFMVHNGKIHVNTPAATTAGCADDSRLAGIVRRAGGSGSTFPANRGALPPCAEAPRLAAAWRTAAV